MLFALAGHPIPLSLERRVDKAMDGWMALGRMGRHRSTLLARSLVRSAVHKSLILTVPLPTLSTAPSTTDADADALPCPTYRADFKRSSKRLPLKREKGGRVERGRDGPPLCSAKIAQCRSESERERVNLLLFVIARLHSIYSSYALDPGSRQRAIFSSEKCFFFCRLLSLRCLRAHETQDRSLTSTELMSEL